MVIQSAAVGQGNKRPSNPSEVTKQRQPRLLAKRLGVPQGCHETVVVQGDSSIEARSRHECENVSKEPSPHPLIVNKECPHHVALARFRCNY